MVNLEAEACGTRVVTYDAGGCREAVHRSDSRVVPIGDLDAILEDLNLGATEKNYFGARVQTVAGKL